MDSSNCSHSHGISSVNVKRFFKLRNFVGFSCFILNNQFISSLTVKYRNNNFNKVKTNPGGPVNKVSFNCSSTSVRKYQSESVKRHNRLVSKKAKINFPPEFHCWRNRLLKIKWLLLRKKISTEKSFITLSAECNSVKVIPQKIIITDNKYLTGQILF